MTGTMVIDHEFQTTMQYLLHVYVYIKLQFNSLVRGSLTLTPNMGDMHVTWMM